MKDLFMLSNVTMILFTKDRQITVQQILDYYSGTNLHLILADASIKAMDKQSLLRKNLNITYMHMPNLTFVERIKYALSLVNTPYSILRADRRHVSCLGIKNACDFLQKNSHYVSAQGKWYTRKQCGICETYSAYRISPVSEIDNKIDRVKKTMAIYSPIFYAVFRSEILIKIFSFFDKFTDELKIELCVQFMAMYNGKHKQLNIPYAFIAPYSQCMPFNKRHYTKNSIFQIDSLVHDFHFSKAVAQYLGINNTQEATLFKLSLEIYQKTFLLTYHNIDCDLKQSIKYFSSYFDKDFSMYAPLILKKIYTEIQAYPSFYKLDELPPGYIKDWHKILNLVGNKLISSKNIQN